MGDRRPPVSTVTGEDAQSSLSSPTASTTHSRSLGAFGHAPREARPLLRYWFGSELRESYKTKWFARPGTNARAAVDKELALHFGDLLRAAETGELLHWRDNASGCSALVLLLDQVSRHLHRGDRAAVECNDAKALEIATWAVENDVHMHVSYGEAVFLLMPLRHSPTKQRLRTVIEELHRVRARAEADGWLLDKFKHTTMEKMHLLESGGAVTSAEGEQWSEGDEILEYAGFDGADDDEMLKHPLARTVWSFLREREYQNERVLVVSLSGGVDSMVLQRILVAIRRHEQRNPPSGPLVLLAVHIDYGNRPESGAEAHFVEQWTAKLGVECFKREIREIKRGVTPRDEYEKRSRAIRYNTYLEAMEQVGGRAVMFGHHQGDLQENVISNLMKGCTLLDLAGMGRESVVNGVPIWRPMLPHTKDVILEFAHRFGVPYFLDTTPTWSTRGKMRNRLMPLLSEMYGDGYLANLSAVAQDSCQLSELVGSSVFEPFLANVETTPGSVWVPCADFATQPLFFWKEALRRICHSVLGCGMIRDKAIQDILMKRLQRMHRAASVSSAPKSCFVALRKDYKTYMTKEGVFVMFRRAFFPSTPYFSVGDTVTVGEHARFGPWEVCLRRVTSAELSRTDESKHAIDSPEGGERETRRNLTLGYKFQSVLEVCSGAFEYVIPDGEAFEIHPMRCAPFTQLEVVLRQALPLVVAREEGDASRETLVVVSMRFDHLSSPTTDR